DRSLQFGPVVIHPGLLLRSAQPYPNHVRTRGVDRVHDFAVFLFRQWTKGGATGAGDSDAVAFLECLGQMVRHSRSTAIEEVPVLAARDLAESLRQFRTIHAPPHVVAMPASEPY